MLRVAGKSAEARMATIAAILTLFAFAPDRLRGETAPAVVDMEEPQVAPEPSREMWRDRIQDAKRRAKEIALERRLHPERYAPPPIDPANEATERVLQDDSLRPGDIVSTSKGLFVFRGRTDQPRHDGDFEALPKR